MVREVTYALGDLVGKGEPAQGSSTTIHDLARPSAYGDVFIMVEPTRNNENQLKDTLAQQLIIYARRNMVTNQLTMNNL